MEGAGEQGFPLLSAITEPIAGLGLWLAEPPIEIAASTLSSAPLSRAARPSRTMSVSGSGKLIESESFAGSAVTG
jgi:hypothetical protein